MNKTYFIQRDEKRVSAIVESHGCSYVLNDSLNIRNHSPTGFEFGYAGSGPAQLALAILVDYLGPDLDQKCDCGWQIDGNQLAPLVFSSIHCPLCHAELLPKLYHKPLSLYQKFKFDVVAKQKGDHWEITSEEIYKWIKKQSER
jgi:hypothetical protein